MKALLKLGSSEVVESQRPIGDTPDDVPRVDPRQSTTRTDPTLVANIVDREPAPPNAVSTLQAFFDPLFAGTGGIDSWIGKDTPSDVIERLARLQEEPMGRAQLSQLLIMSHEAGPSDGFYEYYWLDIPPHTYDVCNHGIDAPDATEPREWTSGQQIRSPEHLRWGLYRFYVDSLLYFGNVRSAYRRLRDMTKEELTEFFLKKRFDTEKLSARGPSLPLTAIPRDDRYLVAEYACKSFDTSTGRSRFSEAILGAYKSHVEQGGSAVVSVDELIQGRFLAENFQGTQQQLQLSADDIINDVVGDEAELEARVAELEVKFARARTAALDNTRRYLSMVEDLDVYVATSMRTRGHFRKMASFCDDVFGHPDLADLNLRYFDPTLSAAEGHIDKGLIECLMVDAASTLV